MKNKIIPFLKKNSMMFVFLLLSAFTSAAVYASRITFVFTDQALFIGFSFILLWISIINAVMMLTLYAVKATDIKHKGKSASETKIFNILYLISIILTIIFTIYAIIYFLTSNAENRIVVTELIIKALPYSAVLFTVMFLLAVFPQMKKGTVKKAVAAVITVSVFISMFLSLYPVSRYKITSDPMVIDNGDNFSIVFATNGTGTGYVNYEYNGENYRVYDESAGRLKNGKIHTVTVPKEHIIGNSYTVGSMRVIEELSYGGRNGKEILSKEYSVTVPTGDDQAYLTLSDWHTANEKAYEASKYAGEYDGIILLGDAVPGLMFEEEIIDYIVNFGGHFSKGEKPIIYIRGNHETRGRYASNLLEYLGLDSFYYMTGYGNYDFIVLDSGEDKIDTHPEYGGMVNYSQYRKNMISWLKELPETDKKTITLVHSAEICIEDDLREQAFTELKKLGITQIISGHEHICDFYEEDGFNIYIDGGINKGGYIASKLTLSSENYRFEAWDNHGEKVFDKILNW